MVFYEFVTTEEALKQQAEKYAKLPARGDIAKESLPKELTAQAIHAMPMDWGKVAAQEAGV